MKTVKDSSLDDELFNFLVDMAQDRGLYVSCHAYTNEEITTAIQAGCDSIEHAFPPTYELAELAISNETIFVPTVYCSRTTSLPEELTDISYENRTIFEKWRKQLHENSDIAIDTGVDIGIGTDAGMPPIGFSNYLKEIRCLAELGFPTERLLQSATVSGAAQVGKIDDWTIAENTRPYLIILDDDPRDDLRYLESARPLVFQGIPIFDNLREFIKV
jgi:imidazolonepropionase-like amidohydrolase